MSNIELRRIFKTTLKGDFAWIREAGLVSTDHEHPDGTGVVVRLKIYLPKRKMIVSDFLLQDGKPPRKKPEYNKLITQVRALKVTLINMMTDTRDITDEDIERTCQDIVNLLSKGKPVTFLEMMKILEFPSYELNNKFKDSERLEPVLA